MTPRIEASVQQESNVESNIIVIVMHENVVWPLNLHEYN